MTTPTRPGDALSETQRRFLVAVMQRLPRELVHEIYLFAPMKQGGVETGIAVIAIGDPPEATDVVADDPRSDAEPAADDGDVGDAIDEAAACDPTDAAAGVAEGVDAEHVDDEHVDMAGVEIEHDVDEEGAALPVVPLRAARFTIHTARYRLQLKGPERGKWDVDVVEEADAPLVTVDAVVRGVHRRSGEPSEVERLAPHDLARALGEIPWTSEN